MAERFWKLRLYIMPEWRGLSVILALTALASVAAAVQPWPMKLLIDAGIRHGQVRVIWMAGAAQLAVAVLSSAIDFGLGWGWAVVGQRMVNRLSMDLFSRLQRLSLQFHARQQVGDSLSRLSRDTWSIYSIASGLLISPLQQLFTLAAVGWVAWGLDRRLALLSFAVAPLIGAASLFFGRHLKHRANASRTAQSRLTSFVQQTLSAMPLVQSLDAREWNGGEFRRRAAEVVVWAKRSALVNSTYGLVTGVITTAGVAIVVFAGAERVLSGALTVGGLLVFAAYTRNLQKSAETLLQTYGSIKPIEASLDRVFEMLEIREAVADRPHARPLRQPRGHIRIEDVTFGYERGARALDGVSIEARPGEMIALVGPTGAGKTTVASLVPRFIDPCEGRVTFDGVDLREITLASLRSQIAVALQEPFLFPVTIAENIAYGKSSATRAAIARAAREANADEFIRRLPEGYDTVLGSRGATLSGGERQRIAIARALVKEAPVLVLDEPTSALDTESEALLLDAVDRARAGRTIFLIAHRLSTAQRADRIVVLERGRVVESGSHATLLKAGGLYSRFHAIHSGDVAAGVSS